MVQKLAQEVYKRDKQQAWKAFLAAMKQAEEAFKRDRKQAWENYLAAIAKEKR